MKIRVGQINSTVRVSRHQPDQFEEFVSGGVVRRAGEVATLNPRTAGESPVFPTSLAVSEGEVRGLMRVDAC